MDATHIKNYWENRAASDHSVQSTTLDYYLRTIEYRVLAEKIKTCRPARVLDVGCGDAHTTIKLATAFPEIAFSGMDYASTMVQNARTSIKTAGIGNLDVYIQDVLQAFDHPPFDLVYSTRCLINLPSWEQQQAALLNIAQALTDNGIYIMIENFIEGHDNFNAIRSLFGLPSIAIREHNLFLNRAACLDFASKYFDVIDEFNISSMYYLVSRIIYTKICHDQRQTPDYYDLHHKYAAQLPFCGEFGPVRMICLRRRNHG